MIGPPFFLLRQVRQTTCSNYGVKTPPVEIVHVVVPEVPTVNGVATYVYALDDIVHIKLKPEFC